MANDPLAISGQFPVATENCGNVAMAATAAATLLGYFEQSFT